METKQNLTVSEAFAAYNHASEVISGCEDIDALDCASDFKTARANCPPDFTEAQRELAQRIILDAHLRSIGRA